jgi:DNA-directed RNA polymerase subunit K/omega
VEQIQTKDAMPHADQDRADKWHLSVDRNQVPNAFEFVVVASARAKQLLQGCLPKVEPSAKPARTAQREVLSGLVHRAEPAQGPTEAEVETEASST